MKNVTMLKLFQVIRTLKSQVACKIEGMRIWNAKMSERLSISITKIPKSIKSTEELDLGSDVGCERLSRYE